ncbi:MAG: AAA family ATPase [Betaproteobacteria bacterium]|uniref:AAA family ATPase n=2 Tax=Acidiphilium TaxID=522 RepID=UPI00157A5F98|nr:AAA family ATPase [Acidiphilium sp. C61]MDE2343675.1 AAA family ATPase [Betaproteobacteria bacterium]UNC16208.1 AAA family ATPase [Acidiphilium multivorum]
MIKLRKLVIPAIILGQAFMSGPAWGNTTGAATVSVPQHQKNTSGGTGKAAKVDIPPLYYRPATAEINANYLHVYVTPHPLIPLAKARELIGSGQTLYLIAFQGVVPEGKNSDRYLVLVMRNGMAWRVRQDISLVKNAYENDVAIVLAHHPSGPFSTGVLSTLSSGISFLIEGILLIFLVVIAFQYMDSLRRSRLRKAVRGGHENIRLTDIAGLESVKEEIAEVIDMIAAPERYAGRAKMPKGILLVGPPGNGKTTIAKAIANEVNTNFYSLNIADVGSMFVSIAPARIRKTIRQIKKTGGILFIDEIEQIAGWRSGGSGRQSDAGQESNRVLSELLVGLDGFETVQGGKPMLLIGATNRPEVIDPALMRPGRLDRHINVPMPDRAEKAAALRLHCRNKPVSSDVDFYRLASMMPGFSMAAVANLVNEAGIASVRDNAPLIEMQHFTTQLDRILLGTPRPSLEMSRQTVLTTAFHEAGHALAALLVDHADRPLRATIVPHGNSLGAVIMDVMDNEFSVTKAKIEARIRVALAGRAAEIAMFGEDNVTTGAENDRDEALDMIGSMVGRFGMIDSAASIGSRRNAGSAGWFGVHERTPLSPVELNRFGDAVCEIYSAAERAVLQLMRSNKAKLEAIAELLLEHKTIDVAQIEEAVQEAG